MNKAIYQNLDSAFVNIPALIRYLCKRGFLGHIRIEMADYEAEIALLGENQVEVIEHDHFSGRTADGEEAMERLLIRVREPGGLISVIQKDALEISDAISASLKPEPQIPIAQPRVDETLCTSAIEIEVERASTREEIVPLDDLFTQMISEPTFDEMVSDNGGNSEDDWHNLLGLTVELLAAIDRSLASSGLGFDAAFAKASSELFEDFPFLRHVTYVGGRLTVGSRPAPNVFATGVMEVVRKIMSRLGTDPRFAAVHRRTIEKLVDQLHQQKETFDRHSLTSPLYRALGMSAAALR